MSLPTNFFAGRGLADTTLYYNPYFISWDDGRGSGYLRAHNVENIARSLGNNISTIANSATVSSYSLNAFVTMHPNGSVYAASNTSYAAFMDATINQTTKSATWSFDTANNTLGYSGGYNYGSGWYYPSPTGDVFGNLTGNNSTRWGSQFASSRTATAWSVNSAASIYSLAAKEDVSFRAGKYLFAYGYDNIQVWDLSVINRPTQTNLVLNTGQNASDATILISPRDNMLGVAYENNTSAWMWDYDTGAVQQVSHGFGTSWSKNRYGGQYAYMHRNTPQDSFDASTYSRSNYKIIMSGYDGSSFSDYTGGSSWTNTNRYWRGCTYNPFSQTMYVFGGDNITTLPSVMYAEAFDSSFAANTSGVMSVTRCYIQNRGPFRGDPFSHKLPYLFESY